MRQDVLLYQSDLSLISQMSLLATLATPSSSSSSSSAPRPIVLILTLLLLALFLHGSSAIKGDLHFTSFDAGRRLVRFAFKSGGRASGEITITPSGLAIGSVQLLLLKRNAYNSLFDVWDTIDICSDRANLNADESWIIPLNDSSVHSYNFSGSVRSGRGIYYILYLNCAYNKLGIRMHYEVVNPGGNQLGWDTEPLPYFYAILAAFWLVSLSVWVFNWIWHRSVMDKPKCLQRPWLHRVISVYPIVKLIWVIYALIYWWTLKKKGEVSSAAYVFFVITYVAQEICLYFIFLLISTGWCIAVEKIKLSYKVGIPVMLLLLAGSLLAGLLFSRYFSLLVMLFYVVVLVCIFMWSRSTLSLLEHRPDESSASSPDSVAGSANGVAAGSSTTESAPPQPAYARNRSVAPAAGSPAYNKYNMINRFRYAMLFYVCLLMVWNFFIVLFLYDYVYVDTMFSELVSCGMAIAIGWIFRLRAQNLYYLLSADSSA